MRLGFVVSLLALPLLVACEREKRDLRLDPPALEALDAIATMPDGISGAPPGVYVAMNRTYEANAYQMSQGKRLYEWFNCTGCHANGGGAAGQLFSTAGGATGRTRSRSSRPFVMAARTACHRIVTS